MKIVRNPSSLAALLKKEQVTVVLFMLSDCPFYHSIRPTFEALAEKLQKTCSCVAVALDDYENPLWDTYAVTVSPTIIVFHGDTVFKRLDGRPGHGLHAHELRRFFAGL